jgi:hypothetical protein
MRRRWNGKDSQISSRKRDGMRRIYRMELEGYIEWKWCEGKLGWISYILINKNNNISLLIKSLRKSYKYLVDQY